MKLKLSHKLISVFIFIGLTPFLFICAYAYKNSKTALEKNAMERLSFLLESRKETISLYLSTVNSQVKTQAQSTMIRDAMLRFTVSFTQFEQRGYMSFSNKQKQITTQLKNRYIYQQVNTIDAPPDASSLWWPEKWNVQSLQYHYITSNPFPIGEKQKMDKSSDDDSFYATVHMKFHPTLRDYVNEFGFYDLFLVEAKNGYIVYTVAKELDFATSLFTGPYADTHLAEVVQKALSADKPATFFSDFSPYPPSFNREAAFIAAPVFDRKGLTGVVVFQLPVNRINKIMTNDQNWQKVGLGKSGESLLIGPDLKFRSNSRYLAQDPQRLEKQLLKMGVPPETIEKALQRETAIDTLTYDNQVVHQALQGESGVALTTDYRGVPVLAGFAPIDTLGTRWAIVTSIDRDEAFTSFIQLKKAMIILGGVGVFAVLVVGFRLARSISRPLNEVIGVLSSSSAQITTSVAQQESVVQQQASAVQETNSTMEELGSSSNQSADQAEFAATGSQQVLDLSGEGQKKMEDMVLGMATLKEKVDEIASQIFHLSEHTGKIGDITDLMTDFAKETKMLAMNAAVEAVRAGEHGKGFSVISVEIRKLADESKRSAEHIHTLVGEIRKLTNDTVMTTEEGIKNVDLGAELAKATSETFQNVTAAISETARNTRQISLNAQQQAVAIKQVVETIGTLNQGAKETTSGIGQVKAGVQTLNDAAQTLKEMVSSGNKRCKKLKLD